jgi:uncharacterized protein
MDDPGLPIKLEPCSNGEYVPPPVSAVVREAVRRARRMCDENARRIGMDRRDFLYTSMGAATTLFALAACSSDSNGGRSGGTYDVSEEATVDADAALEALGSDQPVVDVQTHFLEYPEGYTGFSLADMWPYRQECGAEDANDCFTVEHWIEEIFGRSDTTVAVLSCLPIPGGADPMTAEAMARGRAEMDELCEEGRVVVQGHGQPNFGDLAAMLDGMAAEAEEYDIAAWKSYTHIGEGWSLDDSVGPPIGEAYLAKIEELGGTNIVCVHKGFSAVGSPDQAAFASPADVGPAARNHPDLTFCIYHSGFEAGVAEGPYDPARPNGGVDRLVKSLEDAGIEAGGNVYAELGSTWRTVMGDPDQAAHVLGKLLVAVGEDNILWGTDSIWYGSPQDQIQALRAFEISEQVQEEHGYPALTEEIKHKIFWRNAARLHGIDVARVPCETDPAAAEDRRSSLRRPNRTWGPKTADQARQVFDGEHHFWTSQL